MKKPIKFGKYLLLERINIGGMAEVFKAKSFGVEGFEKMLAIKRILPNIAEDEEFITMFIDEAKIAVQLNHANIAQIYDLGKIDESFFIALEFIAGKDLRTIWDRHKKRGLLLPIPMSVYIISRACEGLDYAHRKKDAAGRDLNIVHRDVSPQNVLISYEGEVKVIDFGIAKAANKASKTQAGILKGKFGYMSPEQVRGLPLDRRSDIFSTGIILYELLTGERLFVGESDFSTLEKVRNVEILPPSTYNRKIPDTLEKIVLKALSKDPDDRFQTAYDMQEELQRFLILNKTNFARKDLANYMKRAFKADIERARKRQAAYASITPDDAEEATGPGINTEPGLGGPPQVTKPTPPPSAAPPPSVAPPPVSPPAVAKAAPPPIAAPPAGNFDVFTGDDDDDDDDVETVIFDPRAQETEDLSTSPGGAPVASAPPVPAGPPPKPQAPVRPPIGSGPKARPAPPPSLLADDFDDEVEETITAPGGLSRPLPSEGPTDSFDVTPPFATDEATAAHDIPPVQAKSKLNLIIIALAVVAVVVVGLAVFKFLQQKGVIGGGVVLTVKVTPPDAKVYLDDKLVGDFSPNVIKDVPPGTHVLLAKRENYQDHQEKIEVPAGEAFSVPIEMSYIPASLEIEVEPADATVKMDGEVIGKASPIKKDDVLSGVEHEFTFERQGYSSKTVTWKLEPKEAKKEKIVLAEMRFDLDVKSEPGGAGVYLDEEPKGKTPLVIKDLKASKTYKLKVKHGRYPEWESTIRHIEGEQVQKIRVHLDASKPKTADDAAREPAPPKPKPKPRSHKPRPRTKPRPVAGKGKLMLNSTPWGKVLVDGKDIKRSTPLLNYELPAGRHKITINFATGESKTVSVVIKANDTVKKIVRLKD